MPAFNFSKQFADAVESGRKRQTIRDTRRAKAGSLATLYTGMRTKACRHLGTKIIKRVRPVEVGRHACGEPYVHLGPVGWDDWRKGDETLTHDALEQFALADGFESLQSFLDWFLRGREVYKGFLYEW